MALKAFNLVFIYNLSTQVYFALIRLFSLFNKKAKLWVGGRKNIFERIQEKLEFNTAPIAWFHCASLGEFEQARPVLERFNKEFPHFKIFLTFFSPSGYEIRKNYAGADYIFYLPGDSKSNAQKFIKLVKPQVVFFTKYEFWYHYLHQLSNAEIPIVCFSAKFRANQLFFKSYGSFYRNILRFFTHLFVQDKDSELLLKSAGINHVTVVGDTRFDRVIEIAEAKKSIAEAEQFSNVKPVIVAGSVWPADLEILYEVINSNVEYKWVIAPHEIHEDELKLMEKNISRETVRFSNKSTDFSTADVLLIDNIGMLSSLYQYGKLAYIGGGFGNGIHNTLEAAVFGLPLFFGPKHEKFKEASDMKKISCAFPVTNTDDLKEYLVRFEDANYYDTCSEAARRYVITNKGATEKIIDFTKSLAK